MEEDLFIDASKKMSLDDFEKIEEIGRGATSITEKYKELKTGQFYCVKKYNQYFYGKEFTRECSALSKLAKIDIPSLLPLYGYKDDDDEKYIITKYYPKNLRDFIENKEQLPPSNTYLIILGIAEGMKYLHSIKKIHRDLKPENILIDINDQGDLNPIICDFGLTREVKKKMTSNVGTNIYRAPELVLPEYDEKIDVYSFSIIFFELYSTEPPFPDENTGGTSFMNKIINEKCRPNTDKLHLNQTIKDYIKLCWDPNPERRPSFEEIVEKLKSKEFRSFLNSDDQKTAEYLAKFKDSLLPKDSSLAKQLADEGRNVDDIIYYANYLLKSDKKEALKYFEKAAQKDNAYSYLQCALLEVDLNHNNEESRLKAAEYLKIAFDHGNYEALQIFIKENYGQLTQGELENCYKKCAESGNPEAMYKYGEILYQKNDKKEALKFFMDAANKRNIPSISRAARMLDEGDGVDENKLKAKSYFDIGIKLNDSYSMLFNAISMLNNNYSEINNAEIVAYFRDASNLMNSNAKLFYSIILKQGYLGECKNYRLSMDNLDQPKNSMSDDDAKLAFYFAKKIMNNEIKCFHSNDEEVFLECSSKKGIVDAMILYADLLSNEKRKTEALKWLMSAANNGSQIAREKYCNLYGIFHKLFFNLEQSRVNYNIDLLEHIITVLTISFNDENKPIIMKNMKKKNACNIDNVLEEIKAAYKFIYDKDLNDVLIRKLLEKNLNESDFQ